MTFQARQTSVTRRRAVWISTRLHTSVLTSIPDAECKNRSACGKLGKTR